MRGDKRLTQRWLVPQYHFGAKASYRRIGPEKMGRREDCNAFFLSGTGDWHIGVTYQFDEQ